MDYVKGIPHKLIALEKFLTAYPQWANKIMLVQIATPPKKDTARYQKLRNKVHKLVGRVNGRFGSLEHTPILYLDQPVGTGLSYTGSRAYPRNDGDVNRHLLSFFFFGVPLDLFTVVAAVMVRRAPCVQTAVRAALPGSQRQRQSHVRVRCRCRPLFHE